MPLIIDTDIGAADVVTAVDGAAFVAFWPNVVCGALQRG
jgi:hypothetical protein